MREKKVKEDGRENYGWCIVYTYLYRRLQQKPLLKLLYAALSVFSPAFTRVLFFPAGTKIGKFFLPFFAFKVSINYFEHRLLTIKSSLCSLFFSVQTLQEV